MAISNVVITVRYGKIEELQKDKLLPGEPAVASNGQIFWCYAAGKTKELASKEDVQELLDLSPDAYNALVQLIKELESSENLSAEILNHLAALDIKTDTTNKEVDSIKRQQYSTKTELSGASITNTDSEKAPLSVLVEGKTIQNGTPSPDAPKSLYSVQNDGGVTVYSSTENLASYPYATSGSNGGLFFTRPNSTVTTGGIRFTDEDGGIKVNGTATSNVQCSLYSPEYPITLPPGDYTLSGCPSGGSSTTYCMPILNGNTAIGTDTGNGVSFHLDVPSKVRFHIIVSSGATINNTIFKPMLNRGERKPYSRNEHSKAMVDLSTSPLRGLPDGTKDTALISAMSDDAEIHRNVGELTFDGSSDENWSMIAGHFVIEKTGVAEKVNAALCTHFRYVQTETEAENGTFRYNGNFIFYYDSITTLDEWKTWLQSNPITIQYPILETTTEIISVAGTLYSYDPVTEVYTDNNLQPNMTAYFRSALWAETTYGDISKRTVNFTEGTIYSKPVTGQNLGTIVGKTVGNVDGLRSDVDQFLHGSVTTIGDTTPLGGIVFLAGNSAPDNTYLAADGAEVSRTTYSALFQKIGTTYGAGDGTSTFNLPDVGDMTSADGAVAMHAYVKSLQGQDTVIAVEKADMDEMQGQISELRSTTLKYVGTYYDEITEREYNNDTIYSYTNNSGKNQVVFFMASFQAPSTGSARYDMYITKEGASSTTYSRTTFPCNHAYPCVNASAPIELAPHESIWCKFWGSTPLTFYGNVAYSVFQKN